MGVNKPLYEITPFKGINNIQLPYNLNKGELMASVNCDLDDRGGLMRRQGYTNRAAGSYHSLYSTGDTGYCIGGSTLFQMVVNTTAVTFLTLRTGLTVGLRMSFQEVNGRVYYSNGVDTGVIDSGFSRSWGLASPIGINAVVSGGGQFRKGRYLITGTYIRNDGQESGAVSVLAVEVPVDGSLLTTTMVPSTDPSVVSRRLYMTTKDGTEMFRVTDAANDGSAIVVTDNGVADLPCHMLYMQKPPAGTIVKYFRGRIYVVAGATVYVSEPNAYELFAQETMTFDSPVVMFEPVDSGIFVSMEKAMMFLEGTDINAFSLRTKFPFPAIPGSSVKVDASETGYKGTSGQAVIWLTKNGVYAGFGDGTARSMDVGVYNPAIAPRANAFFRRHNGMNQYVASLEGTPVAGDVYIPFTVNAETRTETRPQNF